MNAMVLAAGLGLRMRPITLTLPKPLVPVAGRTMLDRVLDHLDRAGAGRKVVNLHWLGETIRSHLDGRQDIVYSHEPELLETGGGVAKALPLLGADPFFVCNADMIWTDHGEPALERIARTAFGYDGQGDFHRRADGRLARRKPDETTPLMFAGVQILHPRLFEGHPGGAFSLNLLYDKAIAAGRLFGLVHDGGWYHIGTPPALAEAEALLG
jgi:MurNAc alpha-1-phosphate uridylyltransferase